MPVSDGGGGETLAVRAMLVAARCGRSECRDECALVGNGIVNGIADENEDAVFDLTVVRSNKETVLCRENRVDNLYYHSNDCNSTVP
jgi:hypothetical protein